CVSAKHITNFAFLICPGPAVAIVLKIRSRRSIAARIRFFFLCGVPIAHPSRKRRWSWRQLYIRQGRDCLAFIGWISE
ncbi:unnamed protein product, partial [Musa textilis]